MSALIDLTGRRFERLEVLGRAESRRYSNSKTEPKWNCRCDCGAEVVVFGVNLRSGNTKSCGCLFREVKSQEAKTLVEKRWRCNDHDETAAPSAGAN